MPGPPFRYKSCFLTLSGATCSIIGIASMSQVVVVSCWFALPLLAVRLPRVLESRARSHQTLHSLALLDHAPRVPR